ncbi:PHP domain-containing protein [Dysgonomonas sp. ZJ279]|uniref:PHP domain-containing protein n=1 Tax=Dysgonomonas sp. ZJ279 TaxID=2709796 RepID=UPI0021026672|nr:PHP domain-containing protein [Dysgonomonas sp. ZJ279]
MDELIKWLHANKISYNTIDNEVIEIVDFGKMFLADLEGVQSIFRGTKEKIEFNLMENPDILIDEGIYYVAFEFGRNWYYYDLREDFKFNILKFIGKRQETKKNIPFVNLGIHTPYELLNGSGDLGLWVKKAKVLGHTAIGICDRNTMAATLNLQKECAKAGLKHVFGYSFLLDYKDEKVDMKIYCQSQKGLRNLLRIQKEIMVDSDTNTLSYAGLLSHAQGNVLVLGKLSSYWMTKNRPLLAELEKAFSKVFYQVDLGEYKAERIDVEVLKATKHYFENFYLPELNSFRIEPVLICDNYYVDQDEARNKIILNKIASGAAHEQSVEQYYKDIDEHYAVFETIFDGDRWDIDALFERMCRHTAEIAEEAEAHYETDKCFMPRYDLIPEEKELYGDSHTMFLSLLAEGFKRLVPKENEEQYRQKLAHEIYILESTDNIDYMLVQYDTVNWARANGILVGCGRGSAGGCLALYLLGITLVDPIKYGLLFERFLLPERAGLYPAKVTITASNIMSCHYIEIQLENNKRLKLDIDAQLLILRDNIEIEVYADELLADDEIIFDNKDLIFSIKANG